MSEVNTKIGNYTITDVDIDTFISGMPQEQQMYRISAKIRNYMCSNAKTVRKTRSVSSSADICPVRAKNFIIG